MKAKVKIIGAGPIVTGAVFTVNKEDANRLESLGLAERYCETTMIRPKRKRGTNENAINNDTD